MCVQKGLQALARPNSKLKRAHLHPSQDGPPSKFHPGGILTKPFEVALFT